MLAITFVSLGIYFYTLKKYVAYIIVFILLATNGFQIIPSSVMYTGLDGALKPMDFSIALLVSSIILSILSNSFADSFREIEIVKLYIYCLVLILIISLVGYDYEIGGVFKSFRSQVFLLTPIAFSGIDNKSITKSLNIINWITVFLCILYVIQAIINVPLLLTFGGDEVTVNFEESVQFTRYYNSPVLIYFSFFYTLYNKSIKKPIKIGFLFIIGSAIVAQQHRSHILMLLLTYIISLLFMEKLNSKIILSSILICASAVIAGNVLLYTKFQMAYDDIQDIFSNNNAEMISSTDSTIAFRISMLIERIQYISQDAIHFMLGIGYVHEYDPFVDNLPLNIGNIQNDFFRISKIETADIAWSSIVLRTGFIGLMLYFTLIIKIILVAYKKQDRIEAKICFSLLVFMLLISFTSSEINNSYTRIIIFILVSTFQSRYSKLSVQTIK